MRQPRSWHRLEWYHHGQTRSMVSHPIWRDWLLYCHITRYMLARDILHTKRSHTIPKMADLITPRIYPTTYSHCPFSKPQGVHERIRTMSSSPHAYASITKSLCQCPHSKTCLLCQSCTRKRIDRTMISPWGKKYNQWSSFGSKLLVHLEHDIMKYMFVSTNRLDSSSHTKILQACTQWYNTLKIWCSWFSTSNSSLPDKSVCLDILHNSSATMKRYTTITQRRIYSSNSASSQCICFVTRCKAGIIARIWTVSMSKRLWHIKQQYRRRRKTSTKTMCIDHHTCHIWRMRTHKNITRIVLYPVIIWISLCSQRTII